MIFTFDERPSDSPFVGGIWCAQSERAGDLLSVAGSHWEMVVSKYRGETIMTVRGPETKAKNFYHQTPRLNDNGPWIAWMGPVQDGRKLNRRTDQHRFREEM